MNGAPAIAFTLVAGTLIMLSGTHMMLKPAFQRRPDRPPPSRELVRTWGFVSFVVGAFAVFSAFSQFVPE
ncbi:hypothetical protein E5A73_12650 [Sphingomonas gei]|uniref:Uncharacterized protein n=1 Tax=Sphingomonas gei TaxID=1395960 RepID=A0A4S1XDB8_9SPHN|nr:hypothetical protein [Sphingomonas gei]TGX53663.1 hypothetical protein E5A73_12650 [Sphingomonas gei]